MSEQNGHDGVTIQATENGPYQVTGNVKIVDADGNEYPIRAGRPAYLCRCGGSQTKPFCDGTHSKVGFDAAERAVKQMEHDRKVS